MRKQEGECNAKAKPRGETLIEAYATNDTTGTWLFKQVALGLFFSNRADMSRDFFCALVFLCASANLVTINIAIWTVSILAFDTKSIGLLYRALYAQLVGLIV